MIFSFSFYEIPSQDEDKIGTLLNLEEDTDTILNFIVLSFTCIKRIESKIIRENVTFKIQEKESKFI